MMLVAGKPSYRKESKAFAQIDICPIIGLDESFPSPRVLNTHYRLDVLPKTFRNGKTVTGE